MKDINLPPFYPTQKVVCVVDLYKLRSIYGYNYPYKGDILTITKCEKVSPSAKCFLCCFVEDVFQDLSHEFFAPVQENFQSISLEKVLEDVTPMISGN